MECSPTTGDVISNLQEDWRSPDVSEDEIAASGRLLYLDESWNGALEVDQEDEGIGDTEEDLNLESWNDDVELQLQETVSMTKEETTLDDDESNMEVDAEFVSLGVVPGRMINLNPGQIWLELEKFLEEKWFAIEFWEKVIKSRMQQAYAEATPVAWPQGKMGEWPCDAVLVYEFCDQDLDIRLHLGSIAAALKIDDIEDDDLCLVISMNDQDEKMKTEPSDWHEFFSRRQILNIRYRGWDERGIQWFGMWNKWVQKIWEFVMIWQQMTYDFVEHHNRHRQKYPDSTFSVLVHCFGGINRSGAATLCLVMMLENITLIEALEKSILKHAPGKQYWQRRDYFIPALLFFQHLNIQPLAEARAGMSQG